MYFLEMLDVVLVRELKPAIEKVANDFDDIFYIVEADEAKDLQKRVGIVGYPTLSILEGRKSYLQCSRRA